MGPRSTAAVKKALEALQEPRETGAGQAGAPRQKRAVAPGQEAPLAFLWRGHQIEAAVTTNTDARHSNARARRARGEAGDEGQEFSLVLNYRQADTRCRGIIISDHNIRAGST